MKAEGKLLGRDVRGGGRGYFANVLVAARRGKAQGLNKETPIYTRSNDAKRAAERQATRLGIEINWKAR